MKLYAIAITTLLVLSMRGEARHLKGTPENRRLNSEIDVVFNGVRPEAIPGWDPGDNEEWDLEFKIEAFKLNMQAMDFDSIADDHDTFTLEVPESDVGDFISIDGETHLSFASSEWESEDIRLYKITVWGTELDDSIDEPSDDDALPRCSKVYNHEGNNFRDSLTCSGAHHEYTVYFRVDEA